MAFRVDLNSGVIEGDSADELAAVMERVDLGASRRTEPSPPAPAKRKKRRKRRVMASMPTKKASKTRTVKKKAAKPAKKAAKKKPATKTKRGGWGPVKAEAKRTGRTDLMALRSEMAAKAKTE